MQKQGNKCAICKQSEKDGHRWGKRPKRLAVDHDHATNKLRGLLCRGCNTGLGHYKDSISLLESAIKYLEKHQKT